MTSFVYTMASIKALPEYAFLSITTLLDYVDPENIIVFYTPPREERHIDAFERLGVDLRFVTNRTEPFNAFESKQHYGEKTWLCTIPDETVVFLDCDTLVFDEIERVVQGNFDFKARQGTSSVHQPDWMELFDRFDRPYLDWMPNAGFMIFKNAIHRELEDLWLEFLHSDLEYEQNINHKEQYALALAIGSYETTQMTPNEHAMLWHELRQDPVVYHIGKTFEYPENV